MSESPKIYLAPFQGVTGIVFREVYSKYFKGIDKLFTPFFTSIQKQKSLSNRAKEIEQTQHHAVEVVPQVLSKDADEIIRFAVFCEEKGFKEINWNLGCPFPRVAMKKRGSGMLPYPDLAHGILEKVFAEIDIEFSIKCRLGYESETEIHALMPVFDQFPLSELIVHARLGKQLYKGEVDLSSFESLIGKSMNPLVYNGDIFTIHDYKNLNSRFKKIDTWMIGRGLLYDPFLPQDIKSGIIVSSVDRKTTIHQFITDLYLAYRKYLNDSLRAIGIMKEYWEYLAVSFDEPNKVFNKVKKVKTFDEYEDAVNIIFRDFEWFGYRKPVIDSI